MQARQNMNGPSMRGCSRRGRIRSSRAGDSKNWEQQNWEQQNWEQQNWEQQNQDLKNSVQQDQTDAGQGQAETVDPQAVTNIFDKFPRIYPFEDNEILICAKNRAQGHRNASEGALGVKQ